METTSGWTPSAGPSPRAPPPGGGGGGGSVLSFGLPADGDHLGLDALCRAVAEGLVAVLVDAAAGVAAGGTLLGIRQLYVGVYGLDHGLLVCRERGAGLHVPAGNAVVAHAAEPGAAVGVYYEIGRG